MDLPISLPRDLTSSAARVVEALIRGGGPVRLLYHIDADGISSGAIALETLRRLGMSAHASPIKYLSEARIGAVLREGYSRVMMVDLGSGYRDLLGEISRKAALIVVDHHEPAGSPPENFVELNPHLLGIDGSKEISGAGTTAVLYLAATGSIRLIHLALVGAIGDQQDVGGFAGLNAEFLRTTKELKILEERTEIRLFGGPEYPLLLSLERTLDPYIPGVSGSSAGALALLEKLGIEPKTNGDWTRLSDLTDRQRRALLSEIIKRMLSAGQEVSPESLIGPAYTLLSEPRGSPLRDLRSFATLLNACGRTGRAAVGVALALGARGSLLERAMSALADYRREIARALDSTPTDEVGELLILRGDRSGVPDTVIGAVTSIVARSKPSLLVVVGVARDSEDPSILKVSARLTRSGQEAGLDLNSLVREAAESAGGSGGGHRSAAGAYIPSKAREEFLTALIRGLRK